MSRISTDLENLYLRSFGSKPYHIDKVSDVKDSGTNGFKINTTNTGGYGTDKLTKDSKGVEIWLPVYLEDLPAEVGDNGKLFLPYSVVRISGSSTVVRTPLAERIGSVKEQYNVEDYKISIKGFFIDKDQRLWPEKDLEALKKIHEFRKAFKITNALTDIFLSHSSLPAIEQKRVIITAFDLPEVEGGRNHVRPFSMTLESDCVFTLEVE